jgi:tRNA(fMet)-specific endonuclease VapC
MTLYVLDTDIVGFAFQRHPTVLQHLQHLPDDDLVVTTIITFGEDLGGWLPACRRAPDGAARARAYARLQRGLDFYRRWVCLPFDEAAAAIFDQLRTQKLRVGTNDLAIAAITLAVSGILVTRNTVDFQHIPGLVLED